MGHSHHHHHQVGNPSREPGTTRLIWSIILNLAITIAEVVGGIISGSLALLSDALHNLSDTTSLAISLVAAKIAKRKPDEGMTFGYRRAEIIGAFGNLIVLVLIAIWLVKESVERFLDPSPVDAPVMLIVATFGLLANIATALLLYRDSKSNLNIKAAYLHIITDALSSVGVILGGLLIWQFGWHIVDPITCVLISVYIIYHSYDMIKETVDILMNSAPADVDLPRLISTVTEVDGVIDVHHVHAWRLNESSNAFEAHVVIDESRLHEMETIKSAIKNVLTDQFRIGHSTLEFELTRCEEPVDHDCLENTPAL